MNVNFKKILVANRGEIACRIIRTAHDMGIKVVAVYSDADKYAKHVRMADEAIHIGPSPSSQSYLIIEKIINAAKLTSAEAIHPGYGFLSENAEFVTAVEAAGLIFIGPAAHAIEMMGDKITSKKIAQEAGVSTVPGSKGAISDIQKAKAECIKIGYPVMVKASAGGGGKGMRVVEREEDLELSMQAAMNEARSSFGDDRVFIEKFVQQPRHIEIQIIADAYGDVIFLGERECSIQRRHQKVIEEAPSCLLSKETRMAMGQQAISLAKAVNYRSAGTVEFIVGADEDFYFLEMNTRLQVEHPVTELVHDVDLVSLMIKIAAGEKLGIKQNDIKADGWAIEARIYAEDSKRGFLPSIGQLVEYKEPCLEKIRIDSGVQEGNHITMFYDPMLAKIISYGADRTECIANLSNALNHYKISGVETNIQFLSAILMDEDFQSGDITTNFIEEKFGGKFVPSTPYLELKKKLLALSGAILMPVFYQSYPEKPNKGQNILQISHEEYFLVDWNYFEGTHIITIDNVQYEVTGQVTKSMSLFTGQVDGEDLPVKVSRVFNKIKLVCGPHAIEVTILPSKAYDLIEIMPEPNLLGGALSVLAPMPGMLTKLLVSEGDILFSGQQVAIIEAMKMENSLRCEIDCIVDRIHVTEGDLLNVDDLILSLSEK